METHNFTKKLGAFSSATLISRLLGYIRDALVAATFGGGMVTDAFYAAFKVPNLLRRFMGEGAMTAAFVPVFTDLKTKKGSVEANHFLNALFSGLIIVLVVVVGLGIVFAPTVAKLVAWGFESNPGKLKLTIELIRIIFPFLIFISLAAFLTAILNSCGRFFIPAVMPSGLSVGEIAFILFVAHHMDSPVHGLAISVVIGGAIHFFGQMPAVYSEGFKLAFTRPFSHPAVKTFFLLLGPTIIGLGSDQINSFVDQLCASFLRDGSITALYNSNRIMQLPLALFGIAVSSVALPALSQYVSENKPTEFKKTLNFSLRIANFVLIPSMFGLIVLGKPIVQLLFEHGKFSSEFTQLTYYALVPYTLGLPAYSAMRILATSFYAQKNTKTPVQVAVVSMILHVVLNLILMRKFDVAGLALSTSIAAWFQVIVLYILAKRKLGSFGGRGIMKSFLYGIISGILMGALGYFMSLWLLSWLTIYLTVPLCIGVCGVFYFGISKVLKIEEYDYFINAITRRKLPDSSG